MRYKEGCLLLQREVKRQRFGARRARSRVTVMRERALEASQAPLRAGWWLGGAPSARIRHGLPFKPSPAK